MVMVSPRLFLLRTAVCHNAVAVAVFIVSIMMMTTSSTAKTTGVVSYFAVQAAQPADIDSTCEDILSPASSNNSNNSNNDRTNFTWTIVVSVSANILCGTTDEEINNDIGQTLLEAYNDVNIFNDNLCDPNTRYVFDYKVQLPTINTTTTTT
eukprot:CAMPEP_0113501392 /NCGR_PEP_ID=MMETSP0014_2-20120614/32927_1 /TAXON_ID=2857 /ORGANISM="Nitzschia sp." /LENGTH=151 /DNA_ID=CAMNT_0000395971 /DNA_START=127 /DNA_END=578 /DNA_ORIENTATION=- /assembly_acc=CAM_ASM_000159